jgi:hypothetical protein
VRLVTKLLKFEGGRIDVEGFLKALEGSYPEMERCYARALEIRPRLNGRLVFVWTVKRSGHAVGVRKIGGTIQNAVFSHCVGGVIRRTVFPKSKGTPVTARLPFIFRRSHI